MSKDIEELAAEDYLQSGDVDARIAYLEDHADPSGYGSGEDWEDALGELRELEEFRDEVTGQKGAAAWWNGVSFIRDDYWAKFAEEEAESLGLDAGMFGPYFDYAKWSRELKTDYQGAELNGITFWYRA